MFSPAACAASACVAQMRAADHAVLMVAKQRLNGLGAIGHLAFAGRRRGVSKSLGALANSCSASSRSSSAASERLSWPPCALACRPSRSSPASALHRAASAAARRRPAPRAHQADGSSAAIASRSATVAGPTGSAAWRPRPAAPAPGPEPDPRAIHRAPSRSARQAPRRRAPPPEPPPTPAARRGSRRRRRCRTRPPTPAAGCGSCAWSPASGAPSRTTSARTARSHTSSCSTCSATARCTGSAEAARRRPVRPASAPLKHARELRTVAGRHRARVQQPVGQPVQQVAVGRLGQFQLPLAPPLLGLSSSSSARATTWSSQNSATATPSGPYSTSTRAVGRDPRDRAKRAVTHDRQHDIQQVLRHGVTAVERCPHLRARVRSCRQFEVPTGVGTSGATAQCHMVGCQIMARSVVIDRVELLRRRALHPRHRRQSLERG